MQNRLVSGSTDGNQANPAGQGSAFALTPAQMVLRQLVLDTLPPAHSKRNYAIALDSLFRFAASDLSPGPS